MLMKVSKWCIMWLFYACLPTVHVLHNGKYYLLELHSIGQLRNENVSPSNGINIWYRIYCYLFILFYSTNPMRLLFLSTCKRGAGVLCGIFSKCRVLNPACLYFVKKISVCKLQKSKFSKPNIFLKAYWRSIYFFSFLKPKLFLYFLSYF